MRKRNIGARSLNKCRARFAARLVSDVTSGRVAKTSPRRVILAKGGRRDGKSSREFALYCAKLIEQKRGQDIVLLNVAKSIQVTDFFVICSGRNKKQNQAIADYIFNETDLSKFGCYKGFSSIQGYKEGSWILVDLGRVILHIFLEPLRRHYDLEFLWASAPRIRTPSTKKPKR